MNDGQESYAERYPRTLSTALMQINSRDRVNPLASNVGNFNIQPIPRDAKILAASLEYCAMPFNFSNVTSEYGHRIAFRYYPDKNNLAVFYTLDIVIPRGFYTTPSLVEFLNSVIEQFFSLHPPISADIITISYSYRDGVLQINSSNLLARIEFLPLLPAIGGLTWVFAMLGLYKHQTTVFVDFDLLSVNYQLFPFPATSSLPFDYVQIKIDLFPPEVFNTNQTNCTFIIPLHGYRASETSYVTNTQGSSHGVVYRKFNNFTQRIVFPYNFPKMTHLNIVLTDSNGLPITNHLGAEEWTMLIFLEKEVN